jgi:uncharacterized repeat protein (TIGR03847 family)
MSEPNVTELRPVSHITTDAIGPPGKRVFYVQARKGERSVSLIIEKFQLQTLAVGVEQFLAQVNDKHRNLAAATADYDEQKMRINPPVEPLFRVGQLGLGYDEAEDLVALELRELAAEGEDAEAQGVARFWCTRSQIRALANWGLEVASRGRPICPQCGQPMEEEGHLCPKKNGHKG